MARTKLGKRKACPCGSDKTFGQCCLARQGDPFDAWQDFYGRVHDWLFERLGEEALLESLWIASFGALEDVDDEMVEGLPEEIFSRILGNAGERLIGEGYVSFRGLDPILCSDLLLEPGGPGSDPEDRARIKFLSESRPSLLRVVDRHPGAGLWLRDLLQEGEDFWVWGPSASEALEEGEVFASRVEKGEPDTLSFGFYPFFEDWVEVAVEELEGPPDWQQELIDIPQDDLWEHRGQVVMGIWLSMLFQEQGYGPAEDVRDLVGIGPDGMDGYEAEDEAFMDVLEKGSAEEIQAVYEEAYGDWADSYVEGLGATPRQAVATAEGQQRVKEMLRALQLMADELGAEDSSLSVDYTFLWCELGLEDEKGPTSGGGKVSGG